MKKDPRIFVHHILESICQLKAYSMESLEALWLQHLASMIIGELNQSVRL